MTTATAEKPAPTMVDMLENVKAQLPIVTPPVWPEPTVEYHTTVEPQTAAPATVSKIATAISAVMAEVGHVAKGGMNEFHRYRYATMENVLQRVTPLMAKHGLAIIQTEKSRSWFDGEKVIAVTYAFTIMHSSGEVWPERPEQSGMCRCRDSKGGFDDKSLNKCHTSARKYFLLALFQIPTGDEDDNDNEKRPPSRPIRQPSTEMNDAIPEHDAETGEIIEPEPEVTSEQAAKYDKELSVAAETGDPVQLKSAWELIPQAYKKVLEVAKNRHKRRCAEVAASLLT